MRALVIFGLVGLFACENSSEPLPLAKAKEQPTQLAATPSLVVTTERTLRPKHARQSPADSRVLIYPRNVAATLNDGFGEFEAGSGAPYVQRMIGGGDLPAPGPHAKRLVSFAHLADMQLLDDEAPTRMAQLDGTGGTAAAFRPQEGFACRIVNAAARTLKIMDAQDPLDFVLLGGDNADNAQMNEVTWALDLLGPDTRTIDCDSGADDDPRPGKNNDEKDPFTSVGLPIPVKWITGNHDILVQGLFTIDGWRDAAVGSRAPLGTRDYSTPDAPVTLNDVPADPRRRLLDRHALMSMIAAHDDGHGITAEQIATGMANYVFDQPGTPLRFVVIDTSAETSGHDGIVRKRDVDRFIKPALDRALKDNKVVVLSSHHAIGSITIDGGPFGVVQKDALTQQEWLALLGNYPNIALSMVAHSHAHQVKAIDTGRTQFWEIMSSSLLDYPAQFRKVEIFDQDNGWLLVRATCVDYVTEDDELAERGRRLTFLDWSTGWSVGNTTEPTDVNVELYVKKRE